MDSISKTELEIKVLEFCENELLPQGIRIVDLDCRVGGKSLLRIFIERAEGESQVRLADCVTVSRHLEPLIEAKNWFPKAYELEVSSPGLDRRLRLRGDFEKAVGEELKLGLVQSVEGVGANVRGVLERVEAGQVFMKVSGKEVGIALGLIQKANTIWDEKRSGSHGV